MTMRRHSLLILAMAAASIAASNNGVFAQKAFSRGAPNVSAGAAPIPMRGGGYNGDDRGDYQGGGYQGGGYRGGFPRGPGFGVIVPGIVSEPQLIDDGFDDGPPGPPPQRRATRRAAGGVPAANERRLVPDEVLIEVANTTSAQTINALQRRHRLTQVEQQTFQLAGTTLYRWRIPDRRSVANVVRSLQGETAVASVQPNYLFTLQNEAKPQGETRPASEGDPAQYELAKLHLPQAHTIAKGDHVPVGVIDSAVDATHPDLAGSVTQSFDAIGTPVTPHDHGTAVAGLIAAHGKLTGAAPDAQILAVRAFDPAGASAEGTTFNILKGLDWAAANGARVINMSFAGPADPDIHRSLEAARKKGIVLIAAAGNAGVASPPLYPAADANVIAVSATDAQDHLFAQSNRGQHIAIAAPGAQILVACPDGGYQVSSGTSYSAAEVSGIAALLLERRPDLKPDQLRAILMASARDLGPKGRDSLFGAGLADAYGALTLEDGALAAASASPR